MREIRDMAVIQIELTNGCILACSNCTRHVGHHRKPFMMDLDTVEKALDSLDGFPGQVGIMGGEPTMHPRFSEILALLADRVPKPRRALWTMGWKWSQHVAQIEQTFEPHLIHYNDHTQKTGRHAPLLVAIDEVIEDPELREKLIDNCPFQSHWSASITPKGVYFCEVAGSVDHLLDGPGGLPIKPGWWERPLEDFHAQRKFSCHKCSGAIPLPSLSDGRGGRDHAPDTVSPGNLARLRAAGSPKIARGDYSVWDFRLSADEVAEELKGHTPRQFRNFEAHNPEDVAKHLRTV